MYNPGGAEQTVVIDGRSLRLGRLRLRVLRAFCAWITEREGDPFGLVERWLGKVPEAETARQLREAEDLRDQLRHFSLGTPVAQKWMGTLEGQAQLFTLLLREVDPSVTEEDGLAVALELGRQAMLGEAIKTAQGMDGAGPAEGNGPAAPAGLTV